MSDEYTKEDYLHMARRRTTALYMIAEKLGKKHAITKMMGTAAWGRNPFETGPQPTLRTAIREMSGLDGMFHILNLWARDNDYAAQKVMLSLYPTSYERVESKRKPNV